MKKFLNDFTKLEDMSLTVPENKYRIYPIQHNLCDPTAQQDNVLDRLREGGAGGIVTNTTWEVPEWTFDENNTKKLKSAVEKARERGFGVWMYDDYYYPSGLANGYAVKDHPEFLAEGIGFEAIETTKNGTYEHVLDKTHGEIFTAAVFDKDYNEIAKAHIVGNTVTALGDGILVVFYKRLILEELDQPVGHAKGHLNHMRKDATESFIENAFKPVDKVVGMNSFDAVFTDEPPLLRTW